MRRFFVALLAAMFLVASLSGCSWMGRTSGKAVQGTKNVYKDAKEGVEGGADDFDKGYEQGKESMKE